MQFSKLSKLFCMLRLSTGSHYFPNFSKGGKVTNLSKNMFSFRSWSNFGWTDLVSSCLVISRPNPLEHPVTRTVLPANILRLVATLFSLEGYIVTFLSYWIFSLSLVQRGSQAQKSILYSRTPVTNLHLS